MATHAVVMFLDGKKELKNVDPEFRDLVALFNSIPFCATFSVSCSGHFYEFNSKTGRNEGDSDMFFAGPYGHLNIIACRNKTHVNELLSLLQKSIASDPDATFKKIDHVFGPSEESEAQVWEIRIGDNGCMKEKHVQNYKKQEHADLHTRVEKRYREIVAFWKSLEDATQEFCSRYGFSDFDPYKREDEICECW